MAETDAALVVDTVRGGAVLPSVWNGSSWVRAASADAAPTTGVGVPAVTPIPTNVAGAAPSAVNTTAYAASLVVKASAGTLFGLSGYNSLASAQFIQVHDAASLPADTAVPEIVLTVAASSNFSISFGTYGRRFGTGIVVCNSSTGPTKTIGAADLWVAAEYV